MLEKLKEKRNEKIIHNAEQRFMDVTRGCAWNMTDDEWNVYYSRILNEVKEINHQRVIVKNMRARLDEFRKSFTTKAE